MTEKINPNRLAETGDPEHDQQPEVQAVSEEMIFTYVTEELKALPPYSARPFAEWLDLNWCEFTEEEATVGRVIEGALSDWRGGCH